VDLGLRKQDGYRLAVGGIHFVGDGRGKRLNARGRGGRTRSHNMAVEEGGVAATVLVAASRTACGGEAGRTRTDS
jgi:hypothetical protein